MIMLRKSADSNNRTAHRWRREFQIPAGTTFLNHASFGPVARRGRKAVEALFRRQAEFKGNPDVDDETFALLGESRQMFAQLTGANSRRVAFVPNASYGLNAVLHGLALKKGDRILVPANEFPAVVYSVRNIAERLDARMIPIPCPSGMPDLDALRDELESGAAALVMSWIQYFNGYRNDISQINRLCHDRGCFLFVDVTQGAGAVPFDMKKNGADAISAGTQKWLLGQTGGGFFAVSPNPIRPVAPPYAGWLGYDWGYTWGNLQRWDRPPFHDGRFWEVGTYPFYSVRLAHAGLSILTECGIKNVYALIRGLLSRLIDGLASTEYRPIMFPDPRNQSAILSFSGPRTDDLHRYLDAKRIFVSLREGNIRVSPHFYNTEGEIDRLIRAVVQFERLRRRK